MHPSFPHNLLRGHDCPWCFSPKHRKQSNSRLATLQRSCTLFRIESRRLYMSCCFPHAPQCDILGFRPSFVSPKNVLCLPYLAFDRVATCTSVILPVKQRTVSEAMVWNSASWRTQVRNAISIFPVVLKYPAVITCKSRQENPQKPTQLSSRSHPKHLVGKRTAQKDTIIDITSASQVNINFPYRWSPTSLTLALAYVTVCT